MISELGIPNRDHRLSSLQPWFVLVMTLGVGYLFALGLQLGGLVGSRLEPNS